jgi:hypothetical protein
LGWTRTRRRLSVRSCSNSARVVECSSNNTDSLAPSTNHRPPIAKLSSFASLTVWLETHIPLIDGAQGDLRCLPRVKFCKLNLSVPHRVSAAADMGGRHDATGLLKLPRKAQLRTCSCDQVSRVCSPKSRHDQFLDGEGGGGDGRWQCREEGAAAIYFFILLSTAECCRSRSIAHSLYLGEASENRKYRTLPGAYLYGTKSSSR